MLIDQRENAFAAPLDLTLQGAHARR